jgi:hypothetical protein
MKTIMFGVLFLFAATAIAQDDMLWVCKAS